MSNRYKILEQIGKGGLGAVYKALDTQLQREVAIKRVLAAGQATEEEVKDAAEKLIAEAQTLSSLNHPNIITVFDVGQDDEGGFVVMELLKGETLDETVERGVLTQDDFTEVVYQTMEALIAAAANDVIHRDIKPTNIMVIWQASGKFQTKILDFGLAKFSKSPSIQTMDQDESVMGSIFFMAPEQFERGQLDSRTDLYQMGCVYYNALTAQYPFNGETAPQVMNAHLQHKVFPLEQVRPDLSPSICQWVMWLINRDIDHRPKDAREALNRWPRNPEPPGAIPVQALPVEEVSAVKTGSVKIVTSANQASAPPALIVGTTTSKIGATTGRLKTAGPPTGAIGRTSRTNVKRTPTPAANSKVKWIVLACSVSILLISAGLIASSKATARANKDRIIELSSAEVPSGEVKDIEIAVDFLNDPKTSASLRGDAFKVVQNLEGNGISEKIFEAMKETESSRTRVQLAKALSERDYTPAVPEIISGFKSADKDSQRLQYLAALQGLADMSNIEEILEALSGDHSREVRQAFEGTVLAVLQKSDNPSPVLDTLLTKVSTTSGNERKSLFRILGVMGGDKTLTRLNAIYNKKNDPEYQRDAMIAYLSWKDRTVLPKVDQIINTTEDSGLRTAAERAYVRLATLPGPEMPAELKPYWDKALKTIENPNDIRRLLSALIESPSAAALQSIQAASQNPKTAPYAKPAIATMNKVLAGVAVIKPGEDLKGNKARVHGDKRVAINSFLSALTSWSSTETWFSWLFKISEPGNYLIEVDQATIRESSSDFVVYLAGKTLNGTSKKTENLETFETIRLDGAVTLEANKIYSIVIAAGDKVQPRMMDISAVRLVKQ
jgi:serine/threonine protein kinase